MPAEKLHLTGSLIIEQGATYAFQAQFTDINGDIFDLTNYTASAQLRHDFADATPSASFTCSIAEPPTSGTLTISLHASHSALITASCYYWGCELTSGSTVIRKYEGKAIVSPQVVK